MTLVAQLDLEKLDITTPTFKADPHPVYRVLRDAHPVAQVNLPGKRPAWLVSRYDDASALLRDERFVKDVNNVERRPGDSPIKTPWMPAFAKPFSRNMLDLDAPDHGRLRGLVHKAFTPKLIETMRAYIVKTTDRLLHAMKARGEADLVHDFAMQLPVDVISEVIGVPQADRGKFHEWSKALASATGNSADAIRILPSMYLFVRYLRRLIALRRAEPADDLLTALVRAEEAGDKLSEDELASMLLILLVAGHETTVNLLASGTLALLQHPDQFALLRDNPGVIQPAVEELVRFVTPVDLTTERYARTDAVIQGVTIPRGALTFAVLGSANRDATQFPDPDHLDLRRDPNRHLAFGQGVHFCLGAPLARLEAQIAFPMLLEQLPRLQLAVPAEKLRWRKSLVMRGLEAMPVRF